MNDREDRRKFLKRFGRYLLFSGLVAGACGLIIKSHDSKKKPNQCSTCSISSVCFLDKNPKMDNK